MLNVLSNLWVSFGRRGFFPSTLAPRHSSLFGGYKAVVRPDPIPNSAVKHSLADGSGFIDSARVGCRQFFLQSRHFPMKRRPFFAHVRECSSTRSVYFRHYAESQCCLSRSELQRVPWRSRTWRKCSNPEARSRCRSVDPGF